MDQIGQRFENYSKLFPEDIMNLNSEIQEAETDASDLFNIDLRNIRKIMDSKQLSLDYRNFQRPPYLLSHALYSGKVRPKSKQDIIRFLLANLHICKDVLISIIQYIRNKLIGKIGDNYNDYKERTNNYLVKVWNEFVGCCENIVTIISEYQLFRHKIHDKLQDNLRALFLDYPDRNKIREGIKDSLIKTVNAQHVVMPSVRLALELPIIEDIGIKIMHKLNRKKRTNKIKDIIPTANLRTEDIFSLMKKMKLCSQDDIIALNSMYEWGSKSVHKGQTIPISAIWYSFFYITNDLVRILGQDSKLSYSDTKKEYDELLYHKKIKVAKEGETLNISFSNF
jgi:hypothetical protein